MEIIIRPDSASVANLAAAILARHLRQNPHSVIGIDGGAGIPEVCATLVKVHREKKLDFSLCSLFAVAEFIGCSIDNRNSRCHSIWAELINHVNVDPRNFHFPDGMAKNMNEECYSYERNIQRHGGIDVQVLTFGAGGNLGFNEPLSPLRSRTHTTPLSPLLADESQLIGLGQSNGPLYGITMGLGTILEARRCIVLVSGRDRADSLARAVEGPITSLTSASALQLHPDCTYIVDKAASSELQGADHYRWMFEHDKKWDEYR